MALDTKTNLSNGKFEQIGTDILSLSGCTKIYGSFNILSGATIQILPNAGLGKSLVSDENGNAAWQLLSGSSGSALSIFTLAGDGTTTGFTLNHAKNKQFVAVEIVRNASPYNTVYTNVSRPNENCVCITFDVAPINGLEYKILITG